MSYLSSLPVGRNTWLTEPVDFLVDDSKAVRNPIAKGGRKQLNTGIALAGRMFSPSFERP